MKIMFNMMKVLHKMMKVKKIKMKIFPTHWWLIKAPPTFLESGEGLKRK
jgi:hypothetical protein